MDSWSWEKGWLQRIDDYNKEVEMKRESDQKEQVQYETKDNIRYWEKHFTGDESQKYFHHISKKVKDANG
jgi:gas vesicle protein